MLLNSLGKPLKDIKEFTHINGNEIDQLERPQLIVPSTEIIIPELPSDDLSMSDVMDMNPMTVGEELHKRTLEEWLALRDYSYLNSDAYLPSLFSMKFMTIVKYINYGVPGTNKSPTMHYNMLDKLSTGHDLIVNLCFRGAAKTTLFGEYMILYLAIFNELPTLKDISGIIYLADSMENGAKSLRQNVATRYEQSEFMQKYVPIFKPTDQYLYFKNITGKQLGVKLFGAQSGIRGVKIFGHRPQLAILDDLMSTEAAESKAKLQRIHDTVNKDLTPALAPKSITIANGTPFNKQDVMLGFIESGNWQVNVYPICEKFPCSREEFEGAWEDRFNYDFINTKYERAKNAGTLNAFYQEYMLQITSDEERLVRDDEILWFSRTQLLMNKDKFNFYITTDFATSTKQSSDYSVIAVWAYNANGDWFLVDAHVDRCTMDVNQEKLFNYVQDYSPAQVGVEASGQQGGFISLFKRTMMDRNIWFNIKSIRPTKDKLTRFNEVVPLFKTNKIYFPQELENSTMIKEFIEELRLATISGLKGKDDCLDTISQLHYLNTWKPSGASSVLVNQDIHFGDEDSMMWGGISLDHDFHSDDSDIGSYIY